MLQDEAQAQHIPMKSLQQNCLVSSTEVFGKILKVGGISISLISQPDVYVLRSHSLLGEGRGVPNDGLKYSSLQGGYQCRSYSIPRIACSPTRADGHLQTYKVTRAIFRVPRTLSALNKL